jgi:hypothetical protein
MLQLDLVTSKTRMVRLLLHIGYVVSSDRFVLTASSNEIRKLLKELRSWVDLEIVDLIFTLHLGDDTTRQDARHQYWIVRQAFARLIRDFIREDPVEDSYRINVFEEGQKETFCLSSKGADCSMRLCIPPTGDQNTLEIMQKALPPMMLSEGNISLTSLHLENMVVDRNSFTLLKKPRINHVILRKVYLLKPVYGPRLAWAKIWRDTVPYVWPHLRTLCVEACAYSAVMLGTDQILYEASLVSEDDLEQDTLELDRLKARLAQRSLSESQ